MIEENVYQGVVNDIPERKLVETKALKAAMTDPLTGLLNRLGFSRLAWIACQPLVCESSDQAMIGRHQEEQPQ